jgi:protein-tyrosine phosphatase
VLAVWIDDSPDACLLDSVLMMLVDAEIAWLRDGGNIYDHCAAGVSRSGYDDVALHMRVLNLSYDDALALVRKGRPQTSPNSGFEAQLRRMEPVLRG